MDKRPAAVIAEQAIAQVGDGCGMQLVLLSQHTLPYRTVGCFSTSRRRSSGPEIQLCGMACQAREVMGHTKLTAIADRGYCKGEDILLCQQDGVTPMAPKTLALSAKADGRFGKQDFVYLPEQDACRCPAGETMTWRLNRVDEHGMTLRYYGTPRCSDCPIKAQCMPAKMRQGFRWEHEGVLDAMQHRLDQAPDTMRSRRQTVEHPFGTLPGWARPTSRPGR